MSVCRLDCDLLTVSLSLISLISVSSTLESATARAQQTETKMESMRAELRQKEVLLLEYQKTTETHERQAQLSARQCEQLTEQLTSLQDDME
jgi:chromosome segregation ATPase